MELEDFTKQRIARVKAIIKKLNSLGIDITYEKVHSYCKGKVIGRPHIAMTLVDEEYIGNFAEAFTKYLGDGCIAFVEKKGLNPQQTIRLIENAGGIAVLAHPYKSGLSDEFIENMVEWGIQGIKGAIGRKYKDMAQRFGLVGTGGSDFHSEGNANGPNCMKMPYTVVQALRERREKSRAEWF